MKISIICLFFLIIISCKNSDTKSDSDISNTIDKETALDKEKFFGESFDITQVENFNYAQDIYSELNLGDTLKMTFKSKVNSVCKKKGCWMKLQLPDGSESMVRFKNYGFFVPKDVENKTAIVHGKAFVTKTSVEDLKHYAKDNGKSEDEIDAILEPEFTKSFEADGVYFE